MSDFAAVLSENLRALGFVSFDGAEGLAGFVSRFAAHLPYDRDGLSDYLVRMLYDRDEVSEVWAEDDEIVSFALDLYDRRSAYRNELRERARLVGLSELDLSLRVDFARHDVRYALDGDVCCSLACYEAVAAVIDLEAARCDSGLVLRRVRHSLGLQSWLFARLVRRHAALIQSYERGARKIPLVVIVDIWRIVRRSLPDELADSRLFEHWALGEFAAALREFEKWEDSSTESCV